MSEPRTNQTAFLVIAIVVAALAVVAVIAVVLFALLGVATVHVSRGVNYYGPVVSGPPVPPSPTAS